jgi:release factor glutamine methyltransferase
MNDFGTPAPPDVASGALSSVGDLLCEVEIELGSAPAARWMLSNATGLADAQLLGALDRRVPAAAAFEVAHMLERWHAGEPLQYVLGRWAFRRLEVWVDRRVLIPRPETEQVVGYALEELHRAVVSAAPDESVIAVDLGTGSGVIALSLAAEIPRSDRSELEVWATDDCANAIDVARTNLSVLRTTDPAAAERVRFREGSWFDALPLDLAGRVRVMASNPPYVSAAEWEGLEPAVRDHEPRRALVGGDTGREMLEVLVSGARDWLAPGGLLVLELAPHQASSMVRAARSAGFIDVQVRPDLAGLPRALVAR